MPRKSKLDRAREFGQQVALNVFKSFQEHPEDRGPSFTWEWLRHIWIPRYVGMQMSMNFEPPCKVRVIYRDAAIEAAKLAIAAIPDPVP
jgi:hypothetical protein